MDRKTSLNRRISTLFLFLFLVQTANCGEVWVGITQDRLMAWIEGEKADLDGSFSLRGLSIHSEEKSHWEATLGASLFYWKRNWQGNFIKLGTEYNWVGVKVNNSYHVASTSRLSVVKMNLEIRISEKLGIFADSRFVSINNVSLINFGDDFNQINFDLSNNAIGFKVKI